MKGEGGGIRYRIHQTVKRDLPVWALQEDLPDEGGVIDHESKSQRSGVLLEFLVNFEGLFEECCVLRLLDVLHTAGEGTKVK